MKHIIILGLCLCLAIIIGIGAVIFIAGGNDYQAMIILEQLRIQRIEAQWAGILQGLIVVGGIGVVWLGVVSGISVVLIGLTGIIRNMNRYQLPEKPGTEKITTDEPYQIPYGV